MGNGEVGACAKQVVKATVVALDGQRFVGYNDCAVPQIVCPRGDLPSGIGYDRCVTICQQQGHAEEQALRKAGPAARGATVYVEGHTHICPNCLRVIADAGAVGVVGAPPEVL